MGINLSKGQGISLKKVEFDLSKVTIGLGWDVNEKVEYSQVIVREKKRGLAGIFGATEEVKKSVATEAPDYDLDVIAFLLVEGDKVETLGPQRNLEDGDVIFFNSPRHRGGAIYLTGDNRNGDGDGDDEQIIADLLNIEKKYKKIVFVVQIYNGEALGQSFGSVENAYIRAVDKNGKEMVRFALSGNSSLSNSRSLKFAELVREGEDWRFNAIGTHYTSDRFTGILREFI